MDAKLFTSTMEALMTGSIDMKEVLIHVMREHPEVVARAICDVSGVNAVPEWIKGVRAIIAQNVMRGQSGKVQGIRYCREQTGMGLKDAKDWIESDPICVQYLQQLNTKG